MGQSIKCMAASALRTLRREVEGKTSVARNEKGLNVDQGSDLSYNHKPSFLPRAGYEGQRRARRTGDRRWEGEGEEGLCVCGDAPQP